MPLDFLIFSPFTSSISTAVDDSSGIDLQRNKIFYKHFEKQVNSPSRSPKRVYCYRCRSLLLV